jgi:hypothetical protein
LLYLNRHEVACADSYPLSGDLLALAGINCVAVMTAEGTMTADASGARRSSVVAHLEPCETR